MMPRSRINPEFCGSIHGGLPLGYVVGLRVCIDRNEDLHAALVCILHAGLDLLVLEVQAREVARVCFVPETQINSICTVIDGRF